MCADKEIATDKASVEWKIWKRHQVYATNIQLRDKHQFKV